MKILLSVLPNFQSYNFLLPHLGNACLKAFLEKNLDNSFSIKTLDLRLNKNIENIWSPNETPQITYKKLFVSDIYEFPLIISLIDTFHKYKSINSLLTPNKDVVTPWALERNKLPDIIMSKLKATNLFALKHINLFGGYDIVCFSLYTSNLYLSIIMAILIRLTYPKTKIIFGGAQVTQSYSTRQILLKGEIADYLVIGEGEQPLLEIAKALSENKNINNFTGIKTIENLHLPDEYSQMKNLDELPTPDYQNTNFSLFPIPVIPVYSNRGCPYSCNFCSEYKLFGKGFRVCSPEKVVQDMNALSAIHRIDEFTLLDSLINSSKSWINEFSDILIKNNKNFKWGGYFRADIDNESIVKMKKSGLVVVALGVESFSDNTLRNMNKRRIKDSIIETINNFVENEIATNVNIVVGFPEETDEDFWQTFNICSELKKKFENKNKLKYFKLTIRNFQLRVFSNVFDDYEKMGVTVKNWEDYYSKDYCPDNLKSLFDETLCSFEINNLPVSEISTRLEFMNQMK